MKKTRIMVACVATFIITGCVLAFIGAMLSDTMTFSMVIKSAPFFFIMLIIGWVPSVLVGADLDEMITD